MNKDMEFGTILSGIKASQAPSCAILENSTACWNRAPQAIQDLLDELESSRQSRLWAWAVLQRFRAALRDIGNVSIEELAEDARRDR